MHCGLTFIYRAEAKSTPPPPKEAAEADDDLVGMVSVPLVADVIELTDFDAVAGEHPVALGGGKEATL